MSSRTNKVADVIPKRLQAAINDLKRGDKVIKGSLSVLPGHDYWWFLEYGTGPFHEAPTGNLDPPAEVAAHEASGEAYDIEAGGNHYLVYMTKYGQRKRARSVVHPGIQPLGMVRTALFEAELYMKEDLAKLAARKNRLLTRQEIVDTVNYILEVLVGELRLLTPDDKDADPFHTHRPHTPPLSRAWRVTKAR
jgi:hypothetical protein